MYKKSLFFLWNKDWSVKNILEFVGFFVVEIIIFYYKKTLKWGILQRIVQFYFNSECVCVCVLVQSSTATLPTHQPKAPLHFLLLLFLIAVFILFYFYFSSKPFNLNPILCLYFPLFFFFYCSLLILLLSLLVSKSLYICTPFLSISSLSAAFSL